MHQETEHLFSQFSEQDPKQLKQVIEALIAKTRILINNLEETWHKLEHAEAERTFWKDSYFNLREACQQYVDSNGLTPFSYIVSLQDELKKEKVYKSCFQQKFKAMKPCPNSNQKALEVDNSFRRAEEQTKEPIKNTIASTMIKQSVGGRYQNKHKIGPKSIEFFKFKEQKSQ